MIKGGKKLLNPLVAAQNFEYKMSNILGMPCAAIHPKAYNLFQTNPWRVALATSLCFLVLSLPIVSVPFLDALWSSISMAIIRWPTVSDQRVSMA